MWRYALTRGMVVLVASVKFEGIYKEFSNNNHLNDEFNTTPNKIFDALLKPH